MSFHVRHRCGRCDANPPVEAFASLHDELEGEDIEHPDIAVEHETAWSLTAFADGLLIWENVEEGDPRQMRAASREDVLRLWRLLAAGDIDAVSSEPWREGYG